MLAVCFKRCKQSAGEVLASSRRRKLHPDIVDVGKIFQCRSQSDSYRREVTTKCWNGCFRLQVAFTFRIDSCRWVWPLKVLILFIKFSAPSSMIELEFQTT